MAATKKSSTARSSEATSTRKGRRKRQEKVSLTAAKIDAAKPLATTYYLWDREEDGFGVRVTPAGGKAYVVKLLYRNKQVWKTIGKISRREKQPLQPGTQRPAKPGAAPAKDIAEDLVIGSRTLTLSQARQLAKDIRNNAAKGLDPNQGSRKKKGAPTIADLVDKFIEEYVDTTKLGEGSKYGYRRHLKVIIKPGLGSIPIRDLSTADVSSFHTGLKETPRQANQALAILRKMMGLAEIWELRAPKTNPCVGIDKFPEEPRERYLSTKELMALGEVLNQAVSKYNMPKAAVAALRLLIHTGARHNEIVKLQWSQVDLEKRHLIFSRKQHKTGKQKGIKKVPLSDAAIKVLKSIKAVPGNPYVIVGEVRGQHFVGLQHVWQRIRNQVSLNEAEKVEKKQKKPQDCVNIEDVRIHDLRHTFASVGASDGQPLTSIGSVLGHSQPSVTNRYAHLQDDPRHAVAETISRILEASLEPKAKVKKPKKK
jgi:integrase